MDDICASMTNSMSARHHQAHPHLPLAEGPGGQGDAAGGGGEGGQAAGAKELLP